MNERKVTMHSAASATATGTWMNVGGMNAVVVQITGTFVASVTWQGTVDESNWVTLQAQDLSTGKFATTAAAAGLYLLNVAGLKRIRANMTWTSGTSITVTAHSTNLTNPQHFATVTDLLTLTLSLDTNAYASADVLAATQELANAVRVSAGTGIIQSIRLNDKDDQGGALELVFLKTNVALGTENAAVSITDANADQIIGIVKVASSDYVDVGGAQIVTKTNVGLAIEAAAGATSIYVAAISRDTKTYTAAGITLMIGILQD
jgi:hypothetical protein